MAAPVLRHGEDSEDLGSGARQVDLSNPVSDFTGLREGQGGAAAIPAPKPVGKPHQSTANAGRGGAPGGPKANTSLKQTNEPPAKGQKGRTRPNSEKQGTTPRTASLKAPVVGVSPVTPGPRSNVNTMRLSSRRGKKRARGF